MRNRSLHPTYFPALRYSRSATEIRRWVSRNMFRIVAACLGRLLMNAVLATDYDQSLGNLTVVLREVEGANKQDNTLRPAGPAQVTLHSGEQVEMTPA